MIKRLTLIIQSCITLLSSLLNQVLVGGGQAVTKGGQNKYDKDINHCTPATKDKRTKESSIWFLLKRVPNER